MKTVTQKRRALELDTGSLPQGITGILDVVFWCCTVYDDRFVAWQGNLPRDGASEHPSIILIPIPPLSAHRRSPTTMAQVQQKLQALSDEYQRLQQGIISPSLSSMIDSLTYNRAAKHCPVATAIRIATTRE
jgi:hypothetical protein